MSLTPLTLNGCQTAASLTTANQLVANQSGTTTGGNSTKIGMAAGTNCWGEIYAQGSTASWPAGGAIGSPSGHGWLYDVTTLEGQTIPAGSWQWVEKVRVTNVNITADIVVRAYKYNSTSHAYTLIGAITLGAQTIGATVAPFTSAMTSLSAVSFATGDKLYIDMWLNITTNNTGTEGATFNVLQCSNATSGFVGIAQMLTPGYQATSTSPILATSPTTLSFAGEVGVTSPASQNDVLSETAGVGTAWTSAITYTTGSGWLSISPASGNLAANGTATIAVTCTTGSLTAGTYTGTVTYTATTGGATATVVVTFTVTAAPALTIAPTTLSFTAVVGGANPAAQTSVLTNSGGTATAWTEAITYGSGSGWLTTTPVSGTRGPGASVNTRYTCTTGTLAVGTYTATVTYTAATGGATATLNVTFTVTPLHFITIAGNPVVFNEDTFQLQKKLDERWRCQFTVLDYAGTQVFSYRQQVVVTDPQMGILFTGYVLDDKQDKTNTYSTAAIEHQIDCIDNRGLADKRTSNYLYANQQAGVIAAHQVQQYLAVEGVTMAAALDWNEGLDEWQEGTMSGVVATQNAYDSNPGDGDIELAPAGSAVTFLENTTAQWNTGTFNGLQAANNQLFLNNHAALSFSANCASGYANPLCYYMIWQGNPGSPYTIASSTFLAYKVWINSSSPAIEAAVDGVCTDGTSFRQKLLPDQNGIACHPQTDLSGFANDQWYYRYIDLTSVAGKTLSYVTIVFEGNNAGQYQAYFYDIQIQDNTGAVVKNLYGSQGAIGGPIIQPQIVQRVNSVGYNNVQITPILAYEQSGTRLSPSKALDGTGGVGIIQSGIISWEEAITSLPGVSPVATTPAGTTLTIATSVDNTATFQAASNIASIPNLIAGADATGKTITTLITMAITGKDPTASPILDGVSWTVMPSYVATKSDTLKAYVTEANWNTGSLVRMTADSSNSIFPTSYLRNWNDAQTNGQTLFGSTSPLQFIYRQQAALSSGTGTDVRSRLDNAGLWNSDFTISCDVTIPPTGATIGLVYKTTTTGWQNANNTFGWVIDLSTATIQIGYGSNTGSGGGSYTQVGSPYTFTPALTAGDVHTLTIAVSNSGQNHTISLDGVMYLTVTGNSTYAAVNGQIGLRGYNASAGNPQAFYFDNFGVMATAQLVSSATPATWTSASIALGSITVGNSLILWEDTVPLGASDTVFISLDGGSTYTQCTNGAAVPGLAPGTVLTSAHALLQVRMECATAAAIPIMAGLSLWVTSAYSSSGTWISPALALTPITNAATALVNWNDNLPNVNTTVAVATSVDGGSTYQTVVNPGDPIANLLLQPPPVEDTFAVDSSANYTETNLADGGAATWTWDTTNSRLLATQTTNTDGILEYNTVTGADMAVQVDLNWSDSGGPMARIVDASDAYFLSIADAQAAITPNTAQLYKVMGGTGPSHGSSVLNPLTLYGSNVADTGGAITTAAQLSATTGGTDVIASTKIGMATGFGEIVALGTTGVWLGHSGAITDSACNPTGKGWLYDVTTLASQQIPGGNWTPTLYLRATTGAPTVDMYVRAFAYDTSASTYTLIGTMVSTGHTLSASVTTYAFSATTIASFTFNSTQKLYIDCWFNISAASSSSSANIAFHQSNNSSAGVAGEMQIVTPGYQVPTVSTALTTYLAGANSKTLTTANQLYTLSGTPSTTTHDVIVGIATGFGELSANTPPGSGGGAPDSPYGVVYYFSGSTPSNLPVQILDLLVGGNRSGLGMETGLVPGGPVWLRPQLLWKQFELTNPMGGTPTYDPTALAVADDMVARCNAANVLVDFCIQAPPQWRRTIALDGTTVPYDGQTYTGTLASTVTANNQYNTVEVRTLKGSETLSDQQQFTIDYNGQYPDIVVAQGNYSAGAHTITVKTPAGKVYKPAHTHNSGCDVLNSGGYFANPADMDYYTSFFAARYNGTTTNAITHAAQTALSIQCMQINEDYDTPGNNPQRDVQSKWFVPNWQLCGPHLRTLFAGTGCKLVGPAARRTAPNGLAHIQTWTDNLFSYQPPGASYAGCVTDGSGNLLLDALDFHYYRDNVQDKSGKQVPDPAIPEYDSTGAYVPTHAQELLAIKAIAAKYKSRNAALANFDVWSTETGWDIADDGSGTINYVTQQQQADFICGPNNSGNIAGNLGAYELHRQNGGSHVFIWTMNPLTTEKTYLNPPVAVTTKNIVQKIIASVGGTPTFTKLPAYLAMQAYIATGPVWATHGSGGWAGGTSIGTPTGYGWMLDATTLEGQMVLAGNWSALIRLGAFQSGSQAGSLGCDIYVRAFQYSGGTYTQLVAMETSSTTTITSSADITLPNTLGTSGTFAVGDKLYIDIWANVKTNGNGSSVQALRIGKISTDTSGLTGASDAAIVTPGYQTTGGTKQITLLASAAINFIRGMFHRFILDVEGTTLTAYMDGVQLLQTTDSSVSGVGSGGLIAGTSNGNMLQCYGLRIAPYGQNVSTLSVLTQVTLTSTDPTQTPQVLDLQTFVASPSIGAGVVIPSAKYQRTFCDKNLDDLSKQSDYGWYIDQFKQLFFQDRQTSPAPWILFSNTLGLPSDIELDSNLLVEVASDLYRNRQVLTNVIGTAAFSDPFVGDGKRTSFTLSYPVAIGSIPVIVLDGQVQSVGKSGGPTAQWYYTEGSVTIAQDASGTTLSGLDTMTIAYTGTFPTEVVLDNTNAQTALAAVEGGSGIVEAVEDVSKLSMTYAAAVVYAQSLLDRYCIEGRTLTVSVYRNGLAVGQILAVIVPEEHLINVRLLITQLDITMQTQPGNTVLYQYVVQATELPNSGSWQKLISSGLL